MGNRTRIEWTRGDDGTPGATWNPITGCTKVSPGCDHCYAETFTERFRGTQGHYFEAGFDVQLRPDKLTDPLRWSRPRRVFVNSMSDLFHDAIPDDYIAQVWAVMAATGAHTYQILTKRPGRMRSLLNSAVFRQTVAEHHLCIIESRFGRAISSASEVVWPLPNVWLGVSAENQRWADVRIPVLLDTPAATRFVSAEPLLGPIDLNDHTVRLDWVIAGGESGPGARVMHPEWARRLRDQCTTAGTAFFFKQWGAWRPLQPDENPTSPAGHHPARVRLDEQVEMVRLGKTRTGCHLDARTWDDFPRPSSPQSPLPTSSGRTHR